MAIDRSGQYWPEDVTLELIEHEGEMKPLGRNLAMKMLLKQGQTPVPVSNKDRVA